MAGPASERHPLRLSVFIVGAGIVVAVVAFVLIGIANEPSKHVASILDRPSVISQAQYRATTIGEQEAPLQTRLGSIGVPEALEGPLPSRVFPHHSGALTCAFWRVRDRPHTLARLCFSSPAGRLTTKRERAVSDSG